MEQLFYSKKESEFKGEISEFLSETLDPLQNQINQTKEIPISLIRKMGKEGLYGPLIPEEYGGSELGMVAHCIITEEISKLNVAASD